MPAPSRAPYVKPAATGRRATDDLSHLHNALDRQSRLTRHTRAQHEVGPACSTNMTARL